MNRFVTVFMHISVEAICLRKNNFGSGNKHCAAEDLLHALICMKNTENISSRFSGNSRRN